MVDSNNMAELYGSYQSYHENVTYKITEKLDWSDPDLKEITRLRLLGDVGNPWLDVSYCHGIDKNNNPVGVQLPFNQIEYRGLNKAIVKHAIRDKVYAKGLKIFDNISICR